ncbi:mucin-5AC isoform X3 [Culex pipiens pallens]|uniref:mucin-5AC isoform X3 n=1 Tax=Culex pipiens pallens TaxID=42434 RepID=UPI0019549476|nr:mucin-5AC isoform X3 [Culex pipiens pallens]
MMGHQHCSSNGGCKSIAYCLVLLLLNVGLLVHAAAQQNNFYFAQNQGRFVPSYENPRNGFFPSSIQRNQPPDSYQEQTLFVGSSAANGGGRPGRGQTGASQVETANDDGPLSSRSGVTPSYFQFTYTRPETGGRDRDRQLSYISNRARPFGNDDSSSSSSSAPAGANPPSRGFPGSTSSSSSSAASHQRQPGARLPPSNARNNGFRSKSEDLGGSSSSSGHHQQNETNNGSSGSGSSSRFTKPTPRANRYRSTTTAEPVTAKSTTVESVVLRNRFAGRTPSPNPFRPAFEAKKVAPVSSNAAAPVPSSSSASRGTFVNKSKKATTTSTSTTTAKAPPASLSRFIIPARPIIPSINITHNGSAKSAEVIYDYDDYVEDPKDPANNEFVDEPQEIKDFQQPQTTTSQKTNSIKSGGSSEKEEKPLVVSTTSSAPTSTTAKEYENEERGGSLNNINENEYYDVVKESDGQQQEQQQQVGETIEDHTVILTDNFYLPNSGSEEVLDDEIEEGEEEDYTEEPKKEVPSSVAPAQEDLKEQLSDSAYDDEYIYDEDEPAVSTTVRPEVKPAVAPAVEDPKEDIDTLIYSEEEEEKPVEDAKVDEEAAPAPSEEVIAETTRAAPIETTSSSTPTTTTTEAAPTQETSTTTERTLNSSVDAEPTSNATTESWVVVASVQTSRSVSGARFLPFPQVEQDEKKQSLSELDSKGSNENDEVDITTVSSHDIEKTTIAPQEPVISVTDDSETPTTEKSVIALSQSTESIIDKLDRVQSELSSGIFKDLPVLKEMIADDKIPTSSSLPPVVIRKFQPNGRATTTKKPRVFPTTAKPTAAPAADLTKKIVFDEVISDEIASLLPPDFKQKNAYKIKKFGVSSTTHVPIASDRDVLNEEPLRPDLGNRFRPANNSRSYKSSVPIQELSSQLPKDRNRTEEEVKTTNNLKELISKIKGNEKPNGTLDVLKKVPKVDISSFLPPGYKPAAEVTTKAPASKFIEDDISKLLPPGYRGAFKPSLKKTTTTTAAPSEDEDLVSKLLPPGYKPPKNEPKVVFSEDISKFLPPGYKPPKEEASTKAPVVFSEDISKFLPPGYKPPAEEAKPEPVVIDPTSLLSKIKFKEVAVPLPPGFNESKPESKPENTAGNAGFKVVFPSRPGVKKPGQGRVTTAKPLHAEGPAQPEITIRRGPPTRATTEFTGWPTPSTTPLSIEKLLEQQKQQELLEKLLASSSTSTTTTTTTTTSTTTPRPTEPGLCHSECDLAGTIRIVDGVNWVPELLDHNTAEWKQLAKDVEAQLNEVYSKAQNLSKWYKKVRIDSFSKGSVLVDYFVELTDLTRDVNTLEIKKLFHEALTPAPVPTTTTPEPSTDLDEDGEDRQSKQVKENLQTAVPRVKEVFLLGKFKVDPVSTDFTVIPKQILPTVTAEEEDLFLPQWAIAVIVIGLASLLFVILFGVTVLINRQKAAKKKAPTPLTADMLNELNKNHMGGIDNFGAEDLYNLDDAWDDHGHDVKTKQRFSNSMHGSSASNIYDSWRSQRHPNEGNYYYDDYGGLKGSHYPPSGHGGHSAHQHSVASAHRLHDAAFMMHEPPLPVMGMYPPYHHAPPPPSSHYNTNSRRYYRDYDPNF